MLKFSIDGAGDKDDVVPDPDPYLVGGDSGILGPSGAVDS
jgi:hypothetical protein